MDPLRPAAGGVTAFIPSVDRFIPSLEPTEAIDARRPGLKLSAEPMEPRLPAEAGGVPPVSELRLLPGPSEP